MTRPPSVLCPEPSAEPTPEEMRNGWNSESLAVYHAEADRRAKGVIYFEPGYRKPAKPVHQNSGYSRMRWRG